MFLAFRECGAKDWRSQVAIAIDHSGAQHRLQFHHIFPKAVLKNGYARREADDISNMCFVAGKTNRQISDKAPSQYFPPLIEKSGVGAFEAQCIPTDPALLPMGTRRSCISAVRLWPSGSINSSASPRYCIHQHRQVSCADVSVVLTPASAYFNRDKACSHY
jgi:hypothetical protein